MILTYKSTFFLLLYKVGGSVCGNFLVFLRAIAKNRILAIVKRFDYAGELARKEILQYWRNC